MSNPVYRLGRHLWSRCSKCGALVKLTGWTRGLHICAPPERGES